MDDARKGMDDFPGGRHSTLTGHKHFALCLFFLYLANNCQSYDYKIAIENVYQ